MNKMERLPTPDVPIVALSGLALSQAISSFRLLAGMVLRASIRNGWVATSAIGSKSFTRSKSSE